MRKSCSTVVRTIGTSTCDRRENRATMLNGQNVLSRTENGPRNLRDASTKKKSTHFPRRGIRAHDAAIEGISFAILGRRVGIVDKTEGGPVIGQRHRLRAFESRIWARSGASRAGTTERGRSHRTVSEPESRTTDECPGLETR